MTKAIEFTERGMLLSPEIESDVTRRQFLIGAGGMLILAPYGCGADSGQGGEATSDDTRAVEHAMGTTQTPLRPERVATDNEAIVSHLAATGLLTVTGSDYIEAWLAPISGLLEPELNPEDISLIGQRDNPTLEAIANARPDMIIVETNTGEDIYDELSQIAPTVVIDRGPNADWKRAFTKTVEAAGRSKEAEEVRARYEETVERVRDRFGDIEVTFIRAETGGGFRVDGTGGFAGSVAEDAGIAVDNGPRGQQDDEAGFGQFSGEVLGEIKGDIIVAAGVFGVSDDEVSSVEQFESNPLWRTIPAVREGRVLTLPGPIYNGASYLAAQLLLEELADFADSQ